MAYQWIYKDIPWVINWNVCRIQFGLYIISTGQVNASRAKANDSVGLYTTPVNMSITPVDLYGWLNGQFNRLVELKNLVSFRQTKRS